jgi:hypothetical protein
MIRKEMLRKGRVATDDIINNLKIASPCHASWEGMEGDDRSRHCGACNKKVYNIAEMTRDEALSLIRENEGRICLQLYRRTDGTVLTKDCPVGLRAVRRKAAYALSCSVMLFFSIQALAMRGGRDPMANIGGIQIHSAAWRSRQRKAVQKLLNLIDPLPQVAGGGAMVGGPPAMPAIRGKMAVQVTLGSPPVAPPTLGTIAAPPKVEMGDVAAPVHILRGEVSAPSKPSTTKIPEEQKKPAKPK